MDGPESLRAGADRRVRRRAALSGVAYLILERTTIAADGPTSKLAKAVGKDTKGAVSALLYAVAIPLAFVNPWIADGIYGCVALMWLVPDRRSNDSSYRECAGHYRSRALCTDAQGCLALKR